MLEHGRVVLQMDQLTGAVRRRVQAGVPGGRKRGCRFKELYAARRSNGRFIANSVRKSRSFKALRMNVSSSIVS